jgi:hypothetical protein
VKARSAGMRVFDVAVYLRCQVAEMKIYNPNGETVIQNTGYRHLEPSAPVATCPDEGVFKVNMLKMTAVSVLRQ